MGLGAGGIIGIILAVLVVAALAGFFLYRHLQLQRQYDAKHFDADYPASKPVELAATQASPAEYDFTSGAATPAEGASGGGDTGKSGASSIAMLNPQAASSPGSYYSAAPTTAAATNGGGGVHLYSANTQPQQQYPQHQEEQPSPFEMSQVKYNQMPSLDSSRSSPPFHSTDEVPLPSKRSLTRFEEESTEFNSGSLAESYTGSYAESYSQSFRGTYGAQSLLGSFDQGNVDTRPFGESLTDNAPRGRESSADASDDGHGGANKSHWMSAMDDMRGTNDSYAMLESGSFDRTSALSRFSTDSDMHARDTNY